MFLMKKRPVFVIVFVLSFSALSWACDRGYYGPDCKNECNTNCGGPDDMCDPRDGKCEAGCDDGFVGEFCDKSCDVGYYGPNCEKKCNLNCIGSKHDNRCDHRDGQCESCDDGFQGDFCHETCLDGTYGWQCQRNCSVHCGGKYDSCFHIDGSCYQSCDPGYRSTRCDKVCHSGEYGAACLQRCSAHCAGTDKTCHHVHGTCPNGCEPGYMPPLCKEPCPSDTYGSECKNCSKHCAGVNKACDRLTGACDLGCESGYLPPRCDEGPTEESSHVHSANSSRLLLIALICVAVGMFIGSALLVIFCRRSKLVRQRESTSSASQAFENRVAYSRYQPYNRPSTQPTQTCQLHVVDSPYLMPLDPHPHPGQANSACGAEQTPQPCYYNQTPDFNDDQNPYSEPENCLI